MSDQASQVTKPYHVGEFERVTSFMCYTRQSLIWGEVVIKSAIRVSTWFRTNVAPDVVCIYNAKLLPIAAGITPRPLQFSEIHVTNPEILAYHLIPPEADPLDYDPTEPNRVMDPVTAIIGAYRIDAKMRMSTRSTLKKYLEITRETFTPLYEAEITNMLMPALGIMKVPMLMVRQACTAFSMVNSLTRQVVE